MRKPLIIAAGLSLCLLGAAALAQTALTPQQTRASAAPAGTYNLDPKHTTVMARMAHAGGTSYSTFRFAKPSGSLVIDPAHPENAQLSVTVDPASIMTPVGPDFVAEITGAQYLNVAKFPTATFKSTSIKVTGAAAVVSGQLTFMGVTKPATIEAELVGGGGALTGGQVLGFTGSMKFKRSDFAFTSGAAFIGDDITVMLDAEFDKV
ncbi:MAG: yceI [Caulobacteraceae bacterium]|nr:yceI [Caulobacteraceae bacterium]